MASLVSKPRHSIQMYWARRSYQRLGSPSRRLKVARLGGGRSAGSAAAASSSWKGIRLARRAVALLAAPALLLSRLRDAYVDAMVALGGSGMRPCAALARSRSGAEAGLWDKRVPRARRGSGGGSGSKRGGGDFERRMMAHIYSMVVTPELPCADRA
ncbi:unnamed protein product [Miscanthus lutarioriparius]|uniref:Uncharacterized protein n=1 Tax=Miscanthus lutarioriparius TaxID=422564 RepID=A0A811RU61_9POAL|nr:unnamed protein product [Miscanthus lutarioriparius]